jgi:hypothetical protein
MVVGFGGWIVNGERWAWWLLAAVAGKVISERFGLDMPWADAMAGGNVVTDAHLWGGIGGASYLLGEMVWQRRQPRV